MRSTVSQPVKKLRSFYRIRKFITVSTTACHGSLSYAILYPRKL